MPESTQDGGERQGACVRRAEKLLAEQDLPALQKWWGGGQIQARKCKLHPLAFWQSSSKALSSSHQKEIREGWRECQAWLSICTDPSCSMANLKLGRGLRRMGKVLHVCGTVAFGSFCSETCPFHFLCQVSWLPSTLIEVVIEAHLLLSALLCCPFAATLLSMVAEEPAEHTLCTGSLAMFRTEPEQRSVVSCKHKCIHDDKLYSKFNIELICTVLVPAPV